MRGSRKLCLIAVLGFLFATSAQAGSADAAGSGSGRINFLRNATSSFDHFLTGSNTPQKQWMASTYWRMRGYDPYFDNVGATAWAPPTHYYEDLYALYRDEPEHQQLIAQHPDWVLRDGLGSPLYIPADCNGQSCTQYAGDVGNPGFRSWWISRAQGKLAKGYAGIFIDDVNMDMKVSDGAAQDAVPIDRRTGQPMTQGNWRRYVAEFTEQIASALPQAEITHNTHWWVSHSDPYVQRQVAAADLIELERGYNDAGLVGGGGQWGYELFMDHIDWLHSMGKSVILEPYDLTAQKQEYEIASYYLTKTGSDAIASSFAADPTNWSTVWETDLGSPRGARYRWKGVWRRDYTNGVVLVNQPDQPKRKLSIEPYRRLATGADLTEVSLPPSRGAVLQGSTDRKKTKTTLSANSRSAFVGLAGRVKRARGQDVELRVESRSGNRWVGVKSLVTKLTRKGRFKAKVAGLPGGPYRAEATYTGGWDTKASSALRRFRVR